MVMGVPADAQTFCETKIRLRKTIPIHEFCIDSPWISKVARLRTIQFETRSSGPGDIFLLYF